MNDVDKIFDAALSFSKELSKLMEKKQEIIRQRRVKAQNNPLTKSRKSRAMKEYWEKKKESERKAIDEERYAAENPYEGCTCHLGNPPCGWCTSADYCEKCDAPFHDDECPDCSGR